MFQVVLKRGFYGIEITNLPGVPRRANILRSNPGYRRSAPSCIDWHHFGANYMPGTFPFLTIRAPRMGFSRHI